jgi:hypothetical protein
MKAIIVTALLFSLLIGSIFVGVINANPTRWNIPTLEIKSPIDWHSIIYTNDSVTLIIIVTISLNIIEISYSLDNQQNISIPNLSNGTFAGTTKGIMGNTTLHNLTGGNHTLRAYSLDTNGNTLSDEVKFIVDLNYQNPKLTIISPQNQTYETNQLPLIFTLNKDYKEVGYSLDQSKPVLIEGNITLNSLSEGSHMIIVFAYVSDKYNLNTGISEDGVSFSINTIKSPYNFALNNQATIIGLTILAIAILAIIVLFYRRRRKQG